MEFEASTVIAADPQQVWAALVDVRRKVRIRQPKLRRSALGARPGW